MAKKWFYVLKWTRWYDGASREEITSSNEDALYFVQDGANFPVYYLAKRFEYASAYKPNDPLPPEAIPWR